MVIYQKGKFEKRDKLFGMLQKWKQKVRAPIPTVLNPEYGK